MKDYLEPYAKENNLLQLSLFYFGKKRPKQTLVEWEDDQGDYKLGCVCKYGVPGSFDQDVYTACMRIWVKQGMPTNSIKVNYSEIARELKLSPPRGWVGRIKKALRRLGQARYEFNKCFFVSDVEGLKKIDTHFSLFDTATLFSHEKGESKRNSESELVFPDKIRENIEAKYYQLLDMVWYRALPEGLPRRLYEYLEKRRYHNKGGYFTISEEIICRWLPITDKHTTKRRKLLLETAQALIEGGYLESYEFEKKKKQCIFKYAQKGPPPGFELETERVPVQEQLFEDEKIPLNTGIQQEVDPYKAALVWVQGIKYFRSNYLQKIKELSRDSVIETFPHVRYMWEKGKIDKPGGVYKAFIESWRDPDVLANKEAQLTKEKQEKAKVIEEAYRVVHKKFIAPVEEKEEKAKLELEEITRQKREETQVKEKEAVRRKQEEHKMEVIAHIAKKGKENLLLMGCEIRDVDLQEGITIKKGDEEQLIKYGNVLVGKNLKDR